MVKFVAVLVAFAFFFTSTCSVFAIESTQTPRTKRDILKQIRTTSSEKRDEKTEALKEKLASKTAQLKGRFLKFKDQKKAERAERINENLNKINEKRIKQMSKHLEKMKKLLARLSSWVEEQGKKGKDTTEAKTAIEKSKQAIDKAQTAVNEQKSKDYSLEASSEAKIKDEAKAMRDKLHQDLSSTRKLVIDAKQSLANAIRVAAKTLGGLKGNGK